MQDTKSMYKNPLYSYILTMKLQKKRKKIPFAIATKKNKILRIKLNKGPIY